MDEDADEHRDARSPSPYAPSAAMTEPPDAEEMTLGDRGCRGGVRSADAETLRGGSMLRVAVVLGLVGVLSGLGLAACGGSDRLSAKDYRARLTMLVVSKHYGDVDVDLKKLGKAKSGAAIRDGLVTLGSEQELFAGEVAKLKPPSDAENANALLARGARDLTLRNNEIASELRVTKSPKAARKGLDTLRNSRGVAEETRALSQLRKLGYLKQG
jgi:hypothetical protein